MRSTVSPRLTEQEAETLVGTLLDDASYDRVIRDDCRLDKPDGTPLLVYRRNALPADACRSAYPALRGAATPTDNRANAGGRFRVGEGYDDVRASARARKASRVQFKYQKDDGALSRAKRGRLIRSGIAGYYDRTTRAPYCRQTAFNVHNAARFEAATPFIRAVDGVFARELPERYEAQRQHVERTNPDFVIRGTVFTTLTVNRNWQTAVHQDVGDLKAGFGVLSVFRAGAYSGGLFVLPRWRVAVDLSTRDVLLVDVHEWHGNTPIVGHGKYERVSVVFYMREAMERCGSAAEELERAKRRRPGDPLYD